MRQFLPIVLLALLAANACAATPHFVVALSPDAGANSSASLRSERLIVVDGEPGGATVSSWSLDQGQRLWQHRVEEPHFLSADVDAAAETVLLTFLAEMESYFTTILVRESGTTEIFRRTKQAYQLAPSGSHMYGTRGGGGPTTSILDASGDPVVLPEPLANQWANVNFVGANHVLVATRDYGQETPDGIPGHLALLSLPATPAWIVPISPGEFQLSSDQEGAIALRDGALSFVERSSPSRLKKLYYLNAHNGDVVWSRDAPGLVGLALDMNLDVIGINPRAIVVFSSATGEVVREIPIFNDRRFVIQVERVVYEQDSTICEVAWGAPGVAPVPGLLMIEGVDEAHFFADVASLKHASPGRVLGVKRTEHAFEVEELR